MTLPTSGKRSVRLTAAAVDDLDGAFAYISERNRSAATGLFGRLRQAVMSLADFPDLGVMLSPEDFELVTPGVRFLVAGPYVVFYRVSTDGVVVLRILHSRRDFLGELLE